MYGYKEKNMSHTKRQKIKFGETEQTSEPDTAGMLELSNLEFKTTIINMPMAVWIM